MELLKQIEKCIANDIKPESETGQEIVSQLNVLSNETFHGDEALMDQFWEVRKQPVEETGLYPISEAVLKFVEQRSEEHTSELQSRGHLVFLLWLENKNSKMKDTIIR